MKGNCHKRANARTLKVLAAAEAAVHVQIRERHRAQLFEIKIEQLAIDLGEVRAVFAGLLLHAALLARRLVFKLGRHVSGMNGGRPAGGGVINRCYTLI